jgi:hypothetical protein
MRLCPEGQVVRSCAAAAAALVLLPSGVLGAEPGARQIDREVAVAVAWVQVAPGQIRRARLLRSEPPEVSTESAPSLAETMPAASLTRAALLALLGAGCLWLAARSRSFKAV